MSAPGKSPGPGDDPGDAPRRRGPPPAPKAGARPGGSGSMRPPRTQGSATFRGLSSFTTPGRGSVRGTGPATPQQPPSTPGPLSSPSTRTIGSSSSKKLTQKQMEKDQITVEQAYPGAFMPLTRANIKKIMNDSSLRTDYMNYPWKRNSVEDEQWVQMKAVILREVQKHFIAFGTNKGVCWAIKTSFPWLDCSTEVFKELRKYGMDAIRNMKHEFLYEKFFSYIVGLRKEFPHRLATTDRKELMSFLSERFDANLARHLFGNSIRVLDVEQTFHNRSSTACWYLRQIYINIALKMVGLVNKEMDMNPNVAWGKMAPRGWKSDKNSRDDINALFDSMCVNDKFKTVELDKFKWASIAGAEEQVFKDYQRRPSEIASEMVFDESPPPNTPVLGTPTAHLSRHSSLASRHSSQGSRHSRHSSIQQTAPSPLSREVFHSPGGTLTTPGGTVASVEQLTPGMSRVRLSTSTGSIPTVPEELRGSVSQSTEKEPLGRDISSRQRAVEQEREARREQQRRREEELGDDDNDNDNDDDDDDDDGDTETHIDPRLLQMPPSAPRIIAPLRSPARGSPPSRPGSLRNTPRHPPPRLEALRSPVRESPQGPSGSVRGTPASQTGTVRHRTPASQASSAQRRREPPQPEIPVRTSSRNRTRQVEESQGSPVQGSRSRRGRRGGRSGGRSGGRTYGFDGAFNDDPIVKTNNVATSTDDVAMSDEDTYREDVIIDHSTGIEGDVDMDDIDMDDMDNDTLDGYTSPTEEYMARSAKYRGGYH
ncbi:hypothetical protein F4775DRAFT_94946 [Biscogniauxia sp. FL1348]|nr:hypothetical protein F4775DRAFT_94946 [Biscogniauxia sp. FL1348]